MYKSYNFNYKNKEEKVYLSRGIYLFECWGASGGSREGKGGKGAFVSGIITINKGRYFYIHVGQQGLVDEKGPTYNGGGSQTKTASNSYSYGGSGGGSSDVRLYSGSWNSSEGLASRIIVAAGGGGASYYHSSESSGGFGGTFEGQSAGYSQTESLDNRPPGEYTHAKGGSQIDGGAPGGINSSPGEKGGFGKGGDGYQETTFECAGAGGGYFGGGGGGQSIHRIGAGAGGSSYISGMRGCIAYSIKNTENPSIHTSGYFFSNPIMKSGNESIFLPNGDISTGNEGNGFVRISFVSELMCSIQKHNNINSYFINKYLSIFLFLHS